MPSEFELIDAFVRCFQVAPSPFGPGDDAAVLKPQPGTCVTCDAVVEDVHFTRATFSLEDVGHKALAVNLSDLAAMGARPRWFICALGVPRGYTVRHLRALGRGMARLAEAHGARLVGGNVTSSQALSVTVTAVGALGGKGALLRSGGRPGDVLYLSGSVGGADWGLEILSGAQRRRSRGAVERQRRPEPRVALGQAIVGLASAAIDVSDGFSSELRHLCRASGVGACIDVEQVPLFPGLPESRRRVALSAGEDYELLIAAPAQKAKALERAGLGVGVPLTPVGVLTRRKRISLRARGREVTSVRGFDHFG